jgi:predicted dehydrogenase
MRGFASGCHVLCEKPLAMSIDEGRRMLAAARAARRRLACCSARFAGAGRHGAAALRERIASGALGRVYRARSIFRWCRSRSGVEYQPGSRWFLRASVNGGGALADWGPYDLAVLIDVLRPVAIEVLAAWTSQPRTSLDASLEADVEFHAGATMRWTQADGNEVVVDLERGSCHHGEGASLCDFEGLAAGARLSWLNGSSSDDPVLLYVDRAGKNETEALPMPASNPLPGMERPLIGLLLSLTDGGGGGVFDADAELGNAVLHAIYDCAATRRPVIVERSAS